MTTLKHQPPASLWHDGTMHRCTQRPPTFSKHRSLCLFYSNKSHRVEKPCYWWYRRIYCSKRVLCVIPSLLAWLKHIVYISHLTHTQWPTFFRRHFPMHSFFNLHIRLTGICVEFFPDSIWFDHFSRSHKFTYIFSQNHFHSTTLNKVLRLPSFANWYSCPK